MSRTIYTERDIALLARAEAAIAPPYGGRPAGPAAEGESPRERADDYASKLLKYVPAESVLVYVLLSRMIEAAAGDPSINVKLALLIGFLVMTAVTPFYLWNVAKVRKKRQIALATVAFAFWAFGLPSTVPLIVEIHPLYKSMLLVLFAFIVPIFHPGDLQAPGASVANGRA